MGECAVLLLDPRFAHNVGAALRAAACFGATSMWWMGDRVPPPSRWPAGARLPREERLNVSRVVDWGHVEGRPPLEPDVVPVCVERSTAAESLVEFVHPARALYVFGPEDGSVPKGWRASCHRFVSIPTANRGPLNLAAAVNVILYDRHAKNARA